VCRSPAQKIDQGGRLKGKFGKAGGIRRHIIRLLLTHFVEKGPLLLLSIYSRLGLKF
jgi:hypothetical protein